MTARVYVAGGISGAIQHLQGIGACDKVVAINMDPGCDMIKRADLSVIGDSSAILKALIEAVDCNGQPPSDDAILTIGNQYNTLVCMGRMWMARVSIWPIESYCDFASERPRSIARISNSEWQF